MKRYLRAACLALLVAAPITADAEDRRHVLVYGSGTAETAPDMATITLGVTHEDEAARVAMDRVSEATAAMLAELASLGVAPTDMQTRQVSLSPVWSDSARAEQNRARITGFVASNTVMVRVRALDDLGRILDAVISSGANDFNGLTFAVSEPDPLLEEARRRAVADAIATARLLAEAAGVTLGPVLSITDNGGGRPQPMQMEMAARGSGMPIAPGEVSVSASVQVVFEIAE